MKQWCCDMYEWLHILRDQKALTQKQIAQKVNISRPYYTSIENGKRRPSPQVAISIATVLNFDWRKFYEDEQAG